MFLVLHATITQQSHDGIDTFSREGRLGAPPYRIVTVALVRSVRTVVFAIAKPAGWDTAQGPSLVAVEAVRGAGWESRPQIRRLHRAIPYEQITHNIIENKPI